MRLFTPKLLLWVMLVLLTPVPTLAQNPCALDPTWDFDGELVTGTGATLPSEMLVLPSGKLLVLDNGRGIPGPAYLRRYLPDGSLDYAFGINGTLTLQVDTLTTEVNGIAYHAGRVYLTGVAKVFSTWAIAYGFVIATTEDGTLLSNFGNNGILALDNGVSATRWNADLVVDAAGDIYAMGHDAQADFVISKFDSLGNLVSSWDGDGVAQVHRAQTSQPFRYWIGRDVALDLNGQLMLAGIAIADSNATIPYHSEDYFLMRFRADGSLDSTFAGEGVAYYNSNSFGTYENFDNPRSIMVSPNNDYVLAGTVLNRLIPSYDYGLAGIRHDGTVNTAFGNNGWALTNTLNDWRWDECMNAEILPDGRMLLGGYSQNQDTNNFALAMYRPDGSLDSSFAPQGVLLSIFGQFNNCTAQTTKLDPAGKVYVAGLVRNCINSVCGPPYSAISRFTFDVGATSSMPHLGADATVFPNPAQAGTLIRIDGLDAETLVGLELMDVSGRCLHTASPAGEMLLPHVAPGIYFLRITTSDAVFTQKLVLW